MLKLLLFLIIEVLVIIVFRQHYKGVSKTKFYLSLTLNAVLSIYFWILYNEIRFATFAPDDAARVWIDMTFRGAVIAILVPRVILIVAHFTGKLINGRRMAHPRGVTNAAIIFWIIILLSVVFGSSAGRYNFRSERITLHHKGLHPDLENLKIALISDIHLAGFYRQPEKLEEVMDIINLEKPDILINAGDFVTVGSNEFGKFDTILSKASGRLASVAVYGNHDIGTYHPAFSAAWRDSNMARIALKIESSGYKLLRDTSMLVKVGNSTLAIAGTVTMGRHPGIIHGSANKALEGTETADYTILISHDPNHWKKEIIKRPDADLTLAGHTHGMQLGIITRWFRWSPSKYFYPEWGGLYKSGDQHLYVNRGLGVLGIPFRIGMPPEITFIELKGTKQN